MRARSLDTEQEAEAFQIALLRRAGPARRLRLAFSLSDSVVRLARAALRRSLAEPSDEQVGIRFVELNYGAGLAAELRRFLAARR